MDIIMTVSISAGWIGALRSLYYAIIATNYVPINNNSSHESSSNKEMTKIW